MNDELAEVEELAEVDRQRIEHFEATHLLNGPLSIAIDPTAAVHEQVRLVADVAHFQGSPPTIEGRGVDVLSALSDLDAAYLIRRL